MTCAHNFLKKDKTLNNFDKLRYYKITFFKSQTGAGPDHIKFNTSETYLKIKNLYVPDSYVDDVNAVFMKRSRPRSLKMQKEQIEWCNFNDIAVI